MSWEKCVQQRRRSTSHPHSLISAFVVRSLDSLMPLVSISQILSLYLVFMAAQAGLCLIWSETPKTGFLMTWLKSWRSAKWAAKWQNQQNECAPSEDSDQPGHSTWRNIGSLATHWAHSEDSDQTGRMSRLIWVFAGRAATLLVWSRRGSY